MAKTYYLTMKSDPGESINSALADAIITAFKENRNVDLIHNDKVFRVNVLEILLFVSDQFHGGEQNAQT